MIINNEGTFYKKDGRWVTRHEVWVPVDDDLATRLDETYAEAVSIGPASDLFCVDQIYDNGKSFSYGYGGVIK